MELTPVAYWLNTSMAGFDETVTAGIHRLYDLAGGIIMTRFMSFVSLLGKGGIFLILLSLCLLLLKKTRRFGTAMIIGLALGALFVNLFLKVVIARPRPYTDMEGFYYPLWLMVGQHTESDMCFPSGHTNAAFAAMVPVFILGNKKSSWLALLFGILMGISRIYLVVHYPTDVVGGFITGTIAGMIGTLVAINLPKKWYRWNLFKKAKVEACSDLAS